MNSADALELFQEIIQQETYTVDFCSRELKWIENRKRDWSSERVRVGVIGVTSSGKSTLINAILGINILSSAIVPSSGQLVCCSYGSTAEIIIYFENGTSQKLSGKDYSRTILEKYSDERFNHGNKKGVLSIELTSPWFDLGKDVLLVDSPGLDAFGMEAHEKLTLESLVPTIDVCIYVTTMKTNSDRKTQEILNTVAKYNCPIIIVQNMLDAVRPSPSGDKAREQVASEHWRRVKRIVDSSNICDKESVRIIQISAENAKRWRSIHANGAGNQISETDYKKSNYQNFVQAVSNILEVQRPRIEKQRMMSIQSCVQEVLTSAQEIVNKPMTRVKEGFSLQSLKVQVLLQESEMTERYQKIMESYRSSAHGIKVAVGTEKSKSFWEKFLSGSPSEQCIKENLNNTNAAVKKLEEELVKLISDYNKFVSETSQILNIPSRDLCCSARLHSFSEVSAEKKIEKKRERVEKSGLFAKIGREVGNYFNPIFNDWGYEYIDYENVVTDIDVTKKIICDRLDDVSNRYSKIMKDWFEKSFCHSMEVFNCELQNAEESYEKRRTATVKADALSRLCTSLTVFASKIEKETPEAHYNNETAKRSPVFTTEEIEVSSYVGSVLKMSRLMLQRQHRALTKALIKRIGCGGYIPVIVGWDDASEKEFLWQTGIKDAVVIDSPVGKAAIPNQKNRCLFILVNTIQYGAALKQIAALKLNKLLSKDDYIVWVVQDFQELLNGGRAAEGLMQMGELSDNTKIPCESSIYILHENPVYNMVFLEYQFNPAVKQTPHKIINEIQTDFNVYSSEEIESILGRMLRNIHWDKREGIIQ